MEAQISWLSDAPIGEWYGVTVDTGGKVVALDLSYNNLGKIPSELGSLSHLVTLELSRNRLAGEIPREMGNLSRFKLSLGDNQLIGEIPSELGSLMALEELMLYFNQLSGDLPATLSKLKNLNALFGNQLSGEIPATLGSLISGRRQPAGGTGSCFTWQPYQSSGAEPIEKPAGGTDFLLHLATLVVLSLSKNRLVGQIPTSLGNLTKLILEDNQLKGLSY